MFDSHCHLTFDGLAERVDHVITDARRAGVRGVITVATASSNVQANRDLAHRFDCVWFSAGVHPLYSSEEPDWSILRRLCADPRCVAFGEMGLDNHYIDPPSDRQRLVLEEQIAFIESCRNDGIDKPVILHCREAFDDLIPILASMPIEPERFVFHCFTGSTDDARKVLDFGAWISFTGVVTYPNARAVAEAARLVPGDRIMVETDAPFLTPMPHRGKWPNEPKHVVHIGRHIAGLRGVEPAVFERTLDANTARFFGLPLDEQ